MSTIDLVLLAAVLVSIAWKPLWKMGKAAMAPKDRDTTQEEILKCLQAIRNDGHRGGMGPTLDKLHSIDDHVNLIMAGSDVGAKALVSIESNFGKQVDLLTAIGFNVSMDVSAKWRLDLLAHMEKVESNVSTMCDHVSKSLASQERVETLLNESVAQTRGVMRAMVGTAGTEDDELLERAQALKQQYPELSLEDALKRARVLQTYSRG